MHYKNHDTDAAHRRMREQLLRMGWTKHKCPYPANGKVELMAAYHSPHIHNSFFWFENCLKRIFTDRYTPNKTFLLPDGTEAKAPAFLACLYDVCIRCGITSPEAPVSDFSNMVKQAAQQCPNAKSFKTAYNTIQTAVREWKPLTGNEAHYYGINVRFHKLKPKDVPQEYKATYNRWLTLYMQVEQIYKETKA